MTRCVFRDYRIVKDAQKLEKTAIELNETVAGAERMLRRRCQGEAQIAIALPHRLEIAAAQNEMVDALHDFSCAACESDGLLVNERSTILTS